ncbi:WD40 repeat-like protein [Phanerochaete sordida]|uniref:WD40 repeat-like protein n=1 Tax=Phanerochaete sordida TaxID=48140 RepID=A0A9P3L9R5_9APHY|nr:WD40 repeat-like protein [Phanerochaete sordida]
MSKRPGSPPPPPGGAVIKRARSSPAPSDQQQMIISSAGEKEQGLVRTVKRTSALEAPIVSLSGSHSAEIMSCRFDPSGQNIVACSADRSVSLWKTYAPNTNYGLLSALHKAPILDVHFSAVHPLLYTASADHTLGVVSLATGERVRKLRAHRGIVNSLDRTVSGVAGGELIVSGSDDGTVRVWEGGDEGGKAPVKVWEIGCPVTAVCWSPDGAVVYAGAIDNEIHVLDIRSDASQLPSLTGHTDTPTSLAVSPNGNFLLSPSLSSQTIIHDIRPFSPTPSRIHRVLMGAPAGFENTLLRGAWSRDDGGKRVGVGGADRTVCIWDVESGQVQYKLPGHKGTVTAVDFHPTEPIVLTGSKDGTMLLGEIEPSVKV